MIPTTKFDVQLALAGAYQRNTTTTEKRGGGEKAVPWRAAVSGRSQNALRAPGGRGPALLSVGLIAERRTGGRGALRRLRGEGTSACPTPRPTAPTAAYHTHEYNWSITTARALSVSPSMCPSARRPLTKALFLASSPAAHPRSTYRWKGREMPQTMTTVAFYDSLVFVHHSTEKPSQTR